MNKFGIIKSKLLTKLTESYANENKAEIKDILTTIKENKDFKEMYLFYEEIENKYIDDKETAQLFVEGVINILKQQMGELSNFCTSLNKMINVETINENEIYNSLDILIENDTLFNIEKKVKAKKKLIEHLTTKKEIKESIFSDYIQRISIKFNNDKLQISIISPRHRRMNRYWDIRTQFEKFMNDLFEKYGYNKDSFELDFV